MQHGNWSGCRLKIDQKDQNGIDGLKWDSNHDQTKWSDLRRNLDCSGDPKCESNHEQTEWSCQQLDLEQSGELK